MEKGGLGIVARGGQLGLFTTYCNTHFILFKCLIQVMSVSGKENRLSIRSFAAGIPHRT